MADARERRRQHAEEAKKVHPMAVVKKYRVPIVIVVIWLAIVGYNVAADRGLVGDPAGGCPGHWHAMVGTYLDDGDAATNNRLVFDNTINPSFGQALSGHHIHDASGRVHMHPAAPRCIPFGDVMEHLGVTISDDRIDVSTSYYYGTPTQASYVTNETHEVRLYELAWDYPAKAHGDAWTQVNDVDKFMDKVVKNGHKVLVAYVAKDVDASVVTAEQDAIGFIGDSYVPSSEVELFVPIMAATMFAILGIVVWRKFALGAA